MVYEDANLRNIINESVNIFKFKAKEKDIKLITEIDLNVPNNFTTDSKRLR